MIFKSFKTLIIIIYSVTICNNVYAATDIVVTQEIYVKLCGVWGLSKGYDISQYPESVFSWGKAKAWPNGSKVIDLGSNNPLFLSGAMGGFNITKAYKDHGIYILRILFRDQKEYDISISVNSDGSIVFHRMEWYKEVLSVPLLGAEDGENHPYYRIDGPDIKYYKAKISNLRIRNNPSSQGKIIRKFTQDEKILIIQKGKEEIIEGAKGNWVKVLTEKSEFGWCFDAYLELVQ